MKLRKTKPELWMADSSNHRSRHMNPVGYGGPAMTSPGGGGHRSSGGGGGGGGGGGHGWWSPVPSAGPPADRSGGGGGGGGGGATVEALLAPPSAAVSRINGTLCWRQWPAAAGDVHENGCVEFVQNWLHRTGDILFVLGYCVLAFVKVGPVAVAVEAAWLSLCPLSIYSLFIR